MTIDCWNNTASVEHYLLRISVLFFNSVFFFVLSKFWLGLVKVVRKTKLSETFIDFLKESFLDFFLVTSVTQIPLVQLHIFIHSQC